MIADAQQADEGVRRDTFKVHVSPEADAAATGLTTRPRPLRKRVKK